MSNKTILVGVILAGLSGPVMMLPAQAHHSFPATYKVDEQTKIQGTVKAFLFRNPHSFVHVMAPDEKGQKQRWAVEWGGGGQLNRQGVTRETLKPGDHVVITGNPGRNPADHRLRMQTILRPADGWKWGGRAGEVVE